MNKKIIILIVIFLLLVPFRLPINVLLIKGFDYIAQLGAELSLEILVANVIVSKIIYNIVLSVIAIINVERLSRKIYGRAAIGPDGTSEPLYWWTAPIIIILLVYGIFDGIYAYKLFYILHQ